MSPEKWEEVAAFVAGLADLVEHQILGETAEHGRRAQAIERMHRMMEYAAGAALYVSQFAADKCVFSVREAKTDGSDERQNAG